MMEKSNQLWLPVLVFFSVLGSASLVHAQSFDRIHLKGEKSPEQGRVVEETMEEVSFHPFRNGSIDELATNSRSWEEVKQIQYHSFPSQYHRLAGAFEEGKFDKAVEHANELLEQTGLREIVRQKTLFLKIKSLRRIAASKKVLKRLDQAIKSFRKEFQGKRRFPTVSKWRVEVLLSLENYGRAFRYLDSMDLDQFSTSFQDRIRYLKGFVREQEERYEEAAEYYRSGKQADTKKFALLSRLGLGRALLALEQFNRARSQFKSVERELSGSDGNRNAANQYPGISIGIQNGLGMIEFYDSFQSAVDTSEKISALKDALLRFMEAILLYPEPGESTVERERAVFWASRCYYELSKLASNEEKGDKYSVEAQKMANWLMNQYPNSKFITKNREILQEIR